MTALQEWLRHHKRHLVQAAIDEALMEYIAHVEKQRDELNRLCEFNEKTTSELIRQRDELLAALEKWQAAANFNERLSAYANGCKAISKAKGGAA